MHTMKSRRLLEDYFYSQTLGSFCCLCGMEARQHHPEVRCSCLHLPHFRLHRFCRRVFGIGGVQAGIRVSWLTSEPSGFRRPLQSIDNVVYPLPQREDALRLIQPIPTDLKFHV